MLQFSDWPILSTVTFLPIVGVLFLLMVRGDDETVARNSRWVAIWTTGCTFVVSLLIWLNFDTTTADFQFVEEASWLGTGIRYKMGVDGISMLFVILTTFLMPVCILASWDAIKDRVSEYMIEIGRAHV